MIEKINLVADFTKPFIDGSSYDRTQQVNIEAFNSSGYSRGILKTISYISPWDWSNDKAKKITDDMQQTFNFYKAIDEDFKNYKLEKCLIKR